MAPLALIENVNSTRPINSKFGFAQHDWITMTFVFELERIPNSYINIQKLGTGDDVVGLFSFFTVSFKIK